MWAGILGFVLAALGAAALLAVVYRVRAVRHLVMEVMHRVTGQRPAFGGVPW